jgi:CCR4-NOT transcription complex subunit 1
VINLCAGVDPKRRTITRPNSTLSFTAPTLYSPSPVPESTRFHSHQEAMERFTVTLRLSIEVGREYSHSCSQILVRDLEAIMIQLPVQSLAALPSNHDIRHLLRQILYLANEAVDRQRTPLMMSQKIVQLLYKTPSQLGREVFVALLDQLCHTFEEVAKEAITWLLYAEDEVRQFLGQWRQPNNRTSIAKIQCCSHCNPFTKRSCEHHLTRSTTCKNLVH